MYFLSQIFYLNKGSNLGTEVTQINWIINAILQRSDLKKHFRLKVKSLCASKKKKKKKKKKRRKRKELELVITDKKKDRTRETLPIFGRLSRGN